MEKFVKWENGDFIVSFPYSKEILSSIKYFPNALYDRQNKLWFVKDVPENLLPLALLITNWEFGTSEYVKGKIEDIVSSDIFKTKLRKMQRWLIWENGNFVLTFPYDEDIVHFMKRFQERKYDPKEKSWTISPTQIFLLSFAVDEFKFRMDSETRQKFDKLKCENISEMQRIFEERQAKNQTKNRK